VTARADAWLEAHPTAADTLLVIEVGDASLAYDLDTNLRLYQQAGIANYWVVDVREPMALAEAQGRPLRQIAALCPEATGLAQPGQAPVGLLLVQKGVDRLTDQGAPVQRGGSACAAWQT